MAIAERSLVIGGFTTPSAPGMNSLAIPTGCEAPLPAVLVVDDDPRVLRGLERALASACTVVSADGGAEGLRLIEEAGEFDAVVCDLDMPRMNGIAFLNALRHSSPDTVRILFTGEAQLTDAVRAINECEVFRVLLKPAAGSTVLAAVKAALRQRALMRVERSLLQDTVHGAIEALSEVLASVHPIAYGRSLRLKRHVHDLAVALGVEPRWDAEVAAMISQLGCTSLAPDLLDRWYHARPLTDDEAVSIARIPQMTETMIAHIPRLDTVRTIIRRQHDAPTAPGLPIGARMLAIARDFDLLIAQGEGADDALSIMQGRPDSYDLSMIAVFRSLRGGEAPAATILEMTLADVRLGMVFAADVYSTRSVLLLARGQVVTASLLERISQVWTSEYAAAITVRVIVP